MQLVIKPKQFNNFEMKTELIYLIFLVFVLPLATNGQSCVIRGIITSEKGGNLLENVNVFETLSGIGTITNSKGEFRLMLNSGDSELQVLYVGYQKFTHKIKLHTDTAINIQLIPKQNYKSVQKESLRTDLVQKRPKK